MFTPLLLQCRPPPLPTLLTPEQPQLMALGVCKCEWERERTDRETVSLHFLHALYGYFLAVGRLTLHPALHCQGLEHSAIAHDLHHILAV